MTDDKHCNRCANAVNRPEIINSKAGEAHEKSWDEWCGKGKNKIPNPDFMYTYGVWNTFSMTELMDECIDSLHWIHNGKANEGEMEKVIKALQFIQSELEHMEFGTDKEHTNDQGFDKMAKETDKLKMVDIKFDDRFLESLWSGEKTSTIRGKKKGEPGDTFLVEYGDLIMEFKIVYVWGTKALTDSNTRAISDREGFYCPEDLIEYIAEKGYEHLWIHEFMLVGQRRKGRRDGIVTTTVMKMPEPMIPEQLPEEDTVKLKKCPICDIFPKLMDYPDGYVYRCQESHCGELWPTKARAAESWNNLVKFMEDP